MVAVSVDLPYAQRAFRRRHELPVPPRQRRRPSADRPIRLAIDFEDIDQRGIAQRAVFVLDDTRTVTYRWVAEEAGDEPPYPEVFAQLGLD